MIQCIVCPTYRVKNYELHGANYPHAVGFWYYLLWYVVHSRYPTFPHRPDAPAYVGIHTITFCTFVYYTYFDNYRSSRTRWMHIIAWTIYALGTANFISTTLFSVRAWNYAHSHGSDAIAWMNENSKHPAHTIEYSSSILAFVLQDCLMVRFYMYRRH